MSDYWGDEGQPVCPILERSMVRVFSFQEWTGPSFPLGELGTFTLFELPAFLWGIFIKMKVVFLKC